MPGMPGEAPRPGGASAGAPAQEVQVRKPGQARSRAASGGRAPRHPAVVPSALPGAGDPATIDPASLPKGFEKFLGQ